MNQWVIDTWVHLSCEVKTVSQGLPVVPMAMIAPQQCTYLCEIRHQ